MRAPSLARHTRRYGRVVHPREEPPRGEGRVVPSPPIVMSVSSGNCFSAPVAVQRYAELSHLDLSAHAKLLRLGTRLWREGRRDRDVDEDETNETRRALTVWTPEFVKVSLEWLALRAALARRRAIWLTRLVDSSVVWREPADSCARLIVIENGEIALNAAVDTNAPPPIPPGCRRPVSAGREAFTLASFDRLRVLTTELKRVR